MNNKKIFLTLCGLCFLVLLITKCNNKKTEATSGTITPKELPVLVPGFHFPEDSNTIYGWMNNKSFPNNYDSASVYNHAWGLWAGLTANSGEKYAGDPLLIFETWLGIGEIQDIIVNGHLDGGCVGQAKNMRSLLSRPHQLQHGQPGVSVSLMKDAAGGGIDKKTSFWVTVSYDPNAACYATQNQILSLKKLNTYLKKDAIGSIPPFPQKAMTIKPTYIVGKVKDKLIQLPVWSGPPETLMGYPDTKWPTVVYADVKNEQQPNKKLVPAPKNSTDPNVIAAATCNLKDFIYFKVDSAMAKHMNEADSTEGLTTAEAGDLAILMAMHVTTKEINNWTWQTYYWAPDPDHPFDPSSDMAAKLRPSQLQGAASHYAVSTAYTMALPNQPNTGGTNAGKSPMLGYNPYLEAGFSGLAPAPNAVFDMPSLLIPGAQYGVQTNCMSCHILATTDGGLGYTTDQYISLDTSLFKNRVQLDFAWSINGNLIIDTGAVTKMKR